MTRIMIIRHAEKPSDNGDDHGVSIDGVHDRHELTVRGWQRAGALVRFFAPLGGTPNGSLIAQPRTIFASAATARSPSLRAQHTVKPLASAIGVAINKQFCEGDEAGLAAAALAAPGPVLIAWHHKPIPRLARLIAGEGLAVPARWPDDRFDMVWVLDQCAAHGRWTFSQAAQNLLAHDRADPI